MPPVDESLREATIAVLRERGWDGLTLERVAEVAGRARSTLWRQGVTLEALVGALAGELDRDFQAALYPVLVSGGTGLERLERGLVALCELIDRHLPLLLATDEAFHQEPRPGKHPDYLHPYIAFIRDGIEPTARSPPPTTSSKRPTCSSTRSHGPTRICAGATSGPPTARRDASSTSC